MAFLKGVGLVAAGLLFGLVLDMVGYNLIHDIVCTPTYPDTCFTTEHASLRPFVNGVLLIIPVVTAVAFGLLQTKAQRAAFICIAAIVCLVLLGAVVETFRPAVPAIGMETNSGVVPAA